MSQQEFMPESQSEKERAGSDEDRNTVQPYYWSTQPKEEPASGRDELLTQSDYASGYQSQNETVYSYPEDSGKATTDFGQTQGQQYQQQQQQFQSQQERNPYAPGDTFGTEYNSYNGYNTYNGYNADNGWQMGQSVPPWARPQRSRGNLRWIWVVLFVIAFMGPMLHFIGAALFFLFPLLFIGLIVVASAVFWSTIGPKRPRGPGGPGPWGW